MTSARSYTVLSIAAALLTIALKLGAYFLTNSVGLLSDAAESVINLIAAVMAFWALTYAALPPDDEHPYGHTKAEYFSSGLEGTLIIFAAATIAYAAWDRLLHPQPLEQLGLGLGLSILASAINGAVAYVLLGAGKRLGSVALKADGHHLLTDVWTSGGVLVALVLVSLTGWLILDPLIAFAVAINITWTGSKLLLETLSALLDRALPAVELDLINQILAPYTTQGVAFHALRTRLAGTRRFISFHLLVPGAWTVQQGHDLSEEIEMALAQALPNTM